MSILDQLQKIAKLGSLKLVYHNIEHFISLNGRPFRPAPYQKECDGGRSWFASAIRTALPGGSG